VEELSRLESLEARDVWQHEAHEFTPWLLANADHLSEVLGIDLELQVAEHPVGGFWLDLFGRDLSNDAVLIVENQLTPTDHGHLGQLLTYAAGTDAATIVWMATDFRDEHRQALDWLNDLAQGNARFFGVEIGAVRIGGSAPAPMFKLRAQPNDWHATVASVTRVSSTNSERDEAFLRFWGMFLERLQIEHPDWTRTRRPKKGHYVDLKSRFRLAHYVLSFASKGRLRVELYIGRGDALENQELFRSLEGSRQQIERSFGEPLEWDEGPGKRICRIMIHRPGDVLELDRHDEYAGWFIQTAERLMAALEPLVGDRLAGEGVR
jgi:hypothetical protein